MGCSMRVYYSDREMALSFFLFGDLDSSDRRVSSIFESTPNLVGIEKAIGDRIDLGHV